MDSNSPSSPSGNVTTNIEPSDSIVDKQEDNHTERNIDMQLDENNSVMYATPKKCGSSSSSNIEIYPHCEEGSKPVIGMVFDSLQEGIDFYKSYAHNVGFSVRLSTEIKKDDFIGWKYVVCSKEGWHKEKESELIELRLSDQFSNNDSSVAEKLGNNKPKIKRRRSITREGCKACCAFKRNSEAKYEIYKFYEGHTHGLATPSKKSMLKSVRNVNPILKNMLRACHQANVGTSKTFQIIKGQTGGIANVDCMKRDLQNYHRDLKTMINFSDAQMFINNLEMIKKKNPSFYFAYLLDEDDHRLKHVFWADGISRKNYAHFRDVISFDTTYGTNKYYLIFVPFTGLNHHRQSITFGVGFLANEQVESFVWLFEKFLEAMEGHKPMCIITDQDPTMKIAIERIFDSSIHKFCIWHIMRKVSKKVGGCLNNDVEFHNRLKSCVWSSETPEEFEFTWLSIMNAYKLNNNDWFSLMFGMRNMWIPCYFRDMLLTGLLRTTSRSESENNMFGNFLNKELTLAEFWMRFKFALDIQRDNEKELDNANSSSMPQLRTTTDIEKHGREIYTHRNFYIFQEECWYAGMDCAVSDVEKENMFKVFTVVDNNKEARKSQRLVTYDATSKEAYCSCKMFELEGIPCRHILVVLKVDSLKEIPESLVVNRCTKIATRKSIFDDNGVLLESCLKDNEKAHKLSSIWGDFNEIMALAEQSEEGIQYVKEMCNGMKKHLAKEGQQVHNKHHDLEDYIGSSIPEKVEIHVPKPSNTKGSGKRIKGGKELAIERTKKQRLCKACGKYGNHDSRNCPIKEW